mgnify:CR=1 FL=1
MTELDPEEFFEDRVLERELRESMRSEEEIDLFKLVRDSIAIRGELAESKALKVVLAGMWENVADFFERVTEAETLAMLPVNDELVIAHNNMRADFAAVARINATLKAAREAEVELMTRDMETEQLEDPR